METPSQSPNYPTEKTWKKIPKQPEKSKRAALNTATYVFSGKKKKKGKRPIVSFVLRRERCAGIDAGSLRCNLTARNTKE